MRVFLHIIRVWLMHEPAHTLPNISEPQLKQDVFGAVAWRCAVSPADILSPPPTTAGYVRTRRVLVLLGVCRDSHLHDLFAAAPQFLLSFCSLLSVNRTSLLQVCLRWRGLHQNCGGERVSR